jgi:hypothetical protein
MTIRFASLARMPLFGTVAMLAGSLALLAVAGPANAIDQTGSAAATSAKFPSARGAHAS